MTAESPSPEGIEYRRKGEFSPELEAFVTPEDHPVLVDGRVMNMNVKGSGKHAVVVLSGRGVTDPTNEYAPLSDRLAVSDDCTVYTVEPFGFGLSDMTNKPRTSDNIVAETYEALSQLGLDRYTLVAHSIAGLYALQFANEHPEKVTGFVGIDTAFPLMDNYITPELLEETSATEDEEASFDVEAEVADVVGYEFSDAQKMRMKFLYERNKTHDAEFEKLKPPGERQSKPYDTMKFPDHIATAFALSSESCGMAPWYEGGHADQLTDSPVSRVEVLDGQHFLHHQQSERIAQMVREVADA